MLYLFLPDLVYLVACGFSRYTHPYNGTRFGTFLQIHGHGGYFGYANSHLVGIRVARGADITDLTRFMADGYEARVKARAPGQRRFTLRASEVPLALMDKLSLMIIRIDPDFRLVSSHIIRTTPYSMVVDMEVLGSSPLTGECRLDKLGMRPIVVKCLPPRRPVAQSVWYPQPWFPFPRRPLSSTEHVSWANIVRSVPKPSYVAGRPVDAASVFSGMPRPAVDPDDDCAEIPQRRHPRPAPWFPRPGRMWVTFPNRMGNMASPKTFTRFWRRSLRPLQPLQQRLLIHLPQPPLPLLRAHRCLPL